MWIFLIFGICVAVADRKVVFENGWRSLFPSGRYRAERVRPLSRKQYNLRNLEWQVGRGQENEGQVR